MNDDSFIKGEYTDYSNYELRHSNLNNEDSATLKEINKLRYRYNMGYITEESYFSKIDNYDYYGFLTDSEMKELNRRHQEHELQKKRERQILQKQYELKKKRQEEWKPVKFIISLILIIILILLGLID
jgi:hypothetical protein